MPHDASRASPSTIPLPESPQATQSDFDALIDLLVTDEPFGSVKHEAPDNHSGLRDEDGRLDFAKIRCLFSSTAKKPRSSTPTSTKVNTEPVGDHGRNTTRTESISYPLRPSGHDLIPTPLQTTAISSLLLTPSPSSFLDSRAFETPLSAVDAEPTPLRANLAVPVKGDVIDLIDLSFERSPSRENAETLQSTLHSPQGIQPPEPHDILSGLKNVLGLAHQEVAALRKRCHELEGLVGNSQDWSSPEENGHEGQDVDLFTSRQNDPKHSMMLSPEGDLAKTRMPFHSMSDEASLELEIDALSPGQTRSALKSLINGLALPPSCISALLKEDPKRRTTSASSLQEVQRALEMLTFVDELVWRRSRFGAPYSNSFSEDNVYALRERLELWEKAVRTRR